MDKKDEQEDKLPSNPEYIKYRLKLLKQLLKMVILSVKANYESKYLKRYLEEIEPHITQALDDKYQRNKFRQLQKKKWEEMYG